MSIVNIYKILSFILLPIAALLGLVCLMSLLVALGSPAILLPLSMLICTVIYIISSFIFLQKGLVKGAKCNSSLKDWIKVNAYVSLFFASMMVWQFIALIIHPELFQQFINQAMAMQKDMPPDAKTVMPKILKDAMYFVFAFGVILLIHISLSLTFLKKYSALFEEN